MNRIRSPLGYPGALEVKNIEWKTKSKPGRGSKNLNVPEVVDTRDDYVKEIWDEYFNLIFYNFELYRRIEDQRTELKKNAKKFYEFLFTKQGKINRVNLLSLLIDDPNGHKKYVLTDKAKGIIKSIFDYKKMTQYYKDVFSALIQMLNVNVCPYCGLSLTSTVNRQKGFIRANQIDHFLPKDDYPWLALSIWNFIPSCGTCNNIKGNKQTEILYPYKEDVGDAFRFRTHPRGNMDYLTDALNLEHDFDVLLDDMDETAESEYHKRIKNEIEMIKMNYNNRE